MADKNSYVKKLFRSYLGGTMTIEERKEFFRLVSDRQNEEEILDLLLYEIENADLSDTQIPTDPDVLFRKIIDEAGQRKNEKVVAKPFLNKKRIWWAVAAGLFLPLAITAYLLTDTSRLNDAKWKKSDISAIDIPPGGNKAVLTLDGGQQIILDTVSNGIITQQSGARIVKSGNGLLEYHTGNEKSENPVFNTVSTPVGGQYQITLSDGTNVWINAASSIRFPAIFTGEMRKVYISGEVYFEVNPKFLTGSGKKMQQKYVPFLVDISGRGVVEVLGTHFNINSYKEENHLKTTLLEGSIKFTPTPGNVSEPSDNTGQVGKSVLLTPGQQVNLNREGEMEVSNNVDLEEVVAWKNGYFRFSSSTLQDVMTQIARWYDIEVILEEKISAEKFSGKIQLNLNLSEVLKILEKNDISFRMEGRKLFVGS
jgi:ferric-dicitrate binding protein FerR (iron transport regulator)